MPFDGDALGRNLGRLIETRCWRCVNNGIARRSGPAKRLGMCESCYEEARDG